MRASTLKNQISGPRALAEARTQIAGQHSQAASLTQAARPRALVLLLAVLAVMAALAVSVYDAEPAMAAEETVHKIKITKSSVAGGWNDAEIKVGYRRTYDGNPGKATRSKTWDVKDKMAGDSSFSVEMTGDDIVVVWVQFYVNIGGGFTVRHCGGKVRYYVDDDLEGEMEYSALSAPFTAGYMQDYFYVNSNGEADYTDNDGRTLSFGNTTSAWSRATKKGGTIKLKSDWNVNFRKVIENQKVTIDLNGYSISRGLKGKDTEEYGDIFLVRRGGDLRIIDSEPRRSNSSDYRGGAIVDCASDSNGGCIHIEDNGKFTMEGGTIADSAASGHGGAIRAGGFRSRLTLKDVTFDSCETRDAVSEINGGAIFITEQPDVLIDGCSFKRCVSEDSGGAIYVDHFETLKIKNTTFYDCKAADDGGAVWFGTSNNNQAVMENCEFVDCSATSGGAMWVERTNLLVDGSKFRYCSSKSDGGAVYSGNPDFYRLFVRNSEIRGCRSKEDGGGIYVVGYYPTLYNDTIIDNTADSYGGGVYVDSDSGINLAGKMVIKDNEVKGSANNLTLQDGYFDDAEFYSGGFSEGSDVRISSTDSGNVTVGKNVNDRQAVKFISFDNSSKSMELRNEYSVSTPLYASLISDDGSVIVVLIGVAATIIAIAVLWKRKRKKDGKE